MFAIVQHDITVLSRLWRVGYQSHQNRVNMLWFTVFALCFTLAAISIMNSQRMLSQFLTCGQMNSHKIDNSILFANVSSESYEATSSSEGNCDDSLKPPFNPFTDFTFTLPNAVTESPYSSIHCVSTGGKDKKYQRGSELSYVSRTCRYTNLYYSPQDQTFHYFASPNEAKLWSKAKENGDQAVSELQQKITTSLAVMRENPKIMPPSHKWLPTLHVGDGKTNSSSPPPKSFSMIGPSGAVFLLYQPYYSFNFGHFVWDDLLPLFSMLDLFGMTGLSRETNEPQVIKDIVPVPFFVEIFDKKTGKNYGGSDPWRRCSPWNWSRWLMCVKMYKRHMSALFHIQPDSSGDILRTGNWLLGKEMIGKGLKEKQKLDGVSKNDAKEMQNEMAPNATYVLLPNVLVGSGRLGHYSCEGDCAIGRGPQFSRFRNFFISNIFGPKCAAQLMKKAPTGYITFSLPGGASRSGKVNFFRNEIKHVRKRYGDSLVRVEDFGNSTMKEQAQLVMNSIIYITNHGGGSASSIFLPRGAGVILYTHSRKGVNKMDNNFYEAYSHIRPTWVPRKDVGDSVKLMEIISVELEKASVWWPGLPAMVKLNQ